jgi:NADP-dependent 3-hydroxy acid dehydrogenase YdfG
MSSVTAPEKSLAGRTAVVTGASSGIGRAIAETLGAAGAHVVLGGRTKTAMDESVQRIAASGGTAVAHVHDVRDVAEARALVNSAVESTGRLDVMVNNAGVSYPEPIVDAEPEHWRVMLETNVLALLVGSQAAVHAMRACGADDGHIVNISSVASLQPASGVYGATKHAVRCINESLRRELLDEPIKVISIMPGAIATSFARNFDPAVLELMVSSMGGSGEETRFTQGDRLPDAVLEQAQKALSEHLCAPEDVAEAVLWAITRPAGVHLAELVVRPKKDLSL